ncbi:VCBS repeat-containing protein [Algoriphagus limi]|uniref:VCBS repeat-containing protein n=1 Tax=Algoriphagus limi TaxID=2975273 RepID=A0ABT2G8B0_9BACT|nr:VCBS repeat-containing protein [Algoriphagus limi]MCS5491521.1 VCBS repeat-containing protein [Algoriphagus limi]
MRRPLQIAIFTLLILGACQKQEPSSEELFEKIESKESGLTFRNDLNYTEKINPYTFRNFYNGAGVALGDINNDGLLDVFLAGNQTSNKLFLNQGNLKFKDITEEAGLNSEGSWTTGVSMADINGDGLLDIYVCKSGPIDTPKRNNELFINQGNLTFVEKASEYGLDEKALSQHAVFFDYDKDGDLDLYLLSNSPRSVGVFDLREGQREIRDPNGGNKLFRNDGNSFKDVSEEAGIYGSAIGYGLGVTVADLNEDNWPDLYVSNDFFERDYLYLNNQDGSFSEVLPDLIPEISMGSMGADIADLDNDNRPDIFVTEMLPEDMGRVKTKTPFEEWDKFQSNFKAGYHRQFTRNTLQRNLGKDPYTGLPLFTEISRMAGVQATDWSWGALIFDADLDGWKDIFVANGIVKDLTDFDFVNYYAFNPDKVNEYRSDSVLITKMIDAFPSTPLQNYWFKNEKDWNFTNLASESGLNEKTFSTGAAYGDLDNDGDLDLVINNLNGEVSLYKNKAIELGKGNFIGIDLGNAFGAKVRILTKETNQIQEFQPVKGYMSSVDQRLFFGLGKSDSIYILNIEWPDGSVNEYRQLATNQILKIQAENPSYSSRTKPDTHSMLNQVELPSSINHQESDFVDFDRDRLRFWSINNEGPKVAFNSKTASGDPILFIPNGKEFPSSLYQLSASSEWEEFKTDIFQADSQAEDIGGVFFDANGDGFDDLLVLSGGIEYPENSSIYSDRLYFQQGNGDFKKSEQVFSKMPSAFALPFDWDEDGDLDLIIGQRAHPYGYGVPVGLTFWENDGQGNFKDSSQSFDPEMQKLGMLTAGALADLNEDGNTELILAGEWMGIRIFSFLNKNWIDQTESFGMQNTSGLWYSLLVDDVNGDGYPDILAGNMGTNTRLNFKNGSTLRMYVNDFDQNGSADHILCEYDGTQSIPWVMKNSLVRQIPALQKSLLRYADYENRKLEELFSANSIANSVILEAKNLETSLWINQRGTEFSKVNLPVTVQQAPVYAATNFEDTQGNRYIALGGNQSKVKPELGTQLASYGWILRLNSLQSWELLEPEESGFVVKGEIRDLKTLKQANNHYLIAFRNDDTPVLFEIRP